LAHPEKIFLATPGKKNYWPSTLEKSFRRQWIPDGLSYLFQTRCSASFSRTKIQTTEHVYFWWLRQGAYAKEMAARHIHTTLRPPSMFPVEGEQSTSCRSGNVRRTFVPKVRLALPRNRPDSCACLGLRGGGQWRRRVYLCEELSSKKATVTHRIRTPGKRCHKLRRQAHTRKELKRLAMQMSQ